MLKRFWNYMKTWFGVKAEQVKDPEIELQQAVNEFRSRDLELRTSAARVLAHRTQVADELEDATKEAAEAKEYAKQALMKADAATQAGDATEAGRWNQAAAAMATKLQAANSNIATLTEQLSVAEEQASKARQAVTTNAGQMSELVSKQTELKGKLKSAQMQESLNRTMEQVNASVGQDAPSLKEIENKIEARAAQAAAEADISKSTPEGAMAELKQSVSLQQADETLADLRTELGIGPAPALPAETAPAEEPAASEPATSAPASPSSPPASPSSAPASPSPATPPSAPAAPTTSSPATPSEGSPPTNP